MLNGLVKGYEKEQIILLQLKVGGMETTETTYEAVFNITEMLGEVLFWLDAASRFSLSLVSLSAYEKRTEWEKRLNKAWKQPSPFRLIQIALKHGYLKLAKKFIEYGAVLCTKEDTELLYEKFIRYIPARQLILVAHPDAIRNLAAQMVMQFTCPNHHPERHVNLIPRSFTYRGDQQSLLTRVATGFLLAGDFKTIENWLEVYVVNTANGDHLPRLLYLLKYALQRCDMQVLAPVNKLLQRIYERTARLEIVETTHTPSFTTCCVAAALGGVQRVEWCLHNLSALPGGRWQSLLSMQMKRFICTPKGKKKISRAAFDSVVAYFRGIFDSDMAEFRGFEKPSNVNMWFVEFLTRDGATLSIRRLKIVYDIFSRQPTQSPINNNVLLELLLCHVAKVKHVDLIWPWVQSWSADIFYKSLFTSARFQSNRKMNLVMEELQKRMPFEFDFAGLRRCLRTSTGIPCLDYLEYIPKPKPEDMRAIVMYHLRIFYSEQVWESDICAYLEQLKRRHTLDEILALGPLSPEEHTNLGAMKHNHDFPEILKPIVALFQ